MLAATWGTLPQWLTLFSLVALGLPLIRGARGVAVRNLRDEARELERRCHELEGQLRDKATEIATLQATRDLAPVQQAMVEAIGQHEERAADRHDRTMVVLDLIATRLGPNAEHG